MTPSQHMEAASRSPQACSSVTGGTLADPRSEARQCTGIACCCVLAGLVVVNFHPELRVLIAEAHYLDRKGFTIPPLALQVALQQGEYKAWTENLERLLQLYYSVRPALCSHDAP